MASNTRLQRVGDLIRAEIGDMILKNLKDPRIGFTSVTRVRVSPDLRHARVYVSVLGDESKVKSALAGLKSSAGHMQRELGARIRLRNIPKLTFFYDDTIEQAAHMEELFKKIHDESPAPEDTDDDVR
jgi:ribosome-binding factor A